MFKRKESLLWQWVRDNRGTASEYIAKAKSMPLLWRRTLLSGRVIVIVSILSLPIYLTMKVAGSIKSIMKEWWAVNKELWRM